MKLKDIFVTIAGGGIGCISALLGYSYTTWQFWLLAMPMCVALPFLVDFLEKN